MVLVVESNLASEGDPQVASKCSIAAFSSRAMFRGCGCGGVVTFPFSSVCFEIPHNEVLRPRHAGCW